MTAAMLSAYEHNMLLMIDGYIASAAILVASKLKPEILNNAIFCHCSSEKAHLTLLNYLNAEPLINLEMRLGEGSGAAIAMQIIDAAHSMYNRMGKLADDNLALPVPS